MSSDSLTVLHSVNRKHAAKRFTLITDKKTGERQIKNRNYGNESLFRVEIIALNGFDDLAAELDRLIGQSFAFPVRGVPAAGTNLNRTPRWKKPRQGQPATFEAAAHHWFCVDMDHLDAPALTDPVTDPDAAIEYLIGLLPPALHDGSCWWEFTSSQSLPKTDLAAPDMLSARLAFWSEVPLTDTDLKRWALAHNAANGGVKIIDPCLYDTIQAHYIAAPSFVGMTDPLPHRYGLRRGLEDTVSLVIPPPHPKRPDEPSTGGYEPGQGVKHYLAQIGKPHFREPIVKAVASFVGSYGAAADAGKLKEAIRKRTDEVVDEVGRGGRSEADIERYKSDDHLDGIIAAIRAFQGDKPGRGFTPEPPDWLLEPPPAGPDDDDKRPVPPVDRPVIQLAGGQLPNILDDAEKVLIARDRSVFAFGDQVVRPARRPIRIADDKMTTGLRLVPIAPAHMAERFTKHIDFQRFDKKTEEWVSVDCPRNVAVAYLERIGMWHLPQLSALTTCPLLLADGRILDKPGYDPASGILFDAQRTSFPSVPRRPTRGHAAEALEFLMAPFAEYPFCDDPSKSVLRSLLLSTVSRFAYEFVPCHAFDATSAGTGKSKLFDCAAILLTGRECAVVSQPEDATEFEKKLFAELLAGDPLVSIDNCDLGLDNPFLCMTITQRFVKSRLLGLSKNPEIPNTVIIGANGNNFSYAGDMLRRGLTGHLDAGTEKPWEREFSSEDPVIVFKRERPKLVAAAITVLRGYIAAGRPKMEAPPLGGFEGWCRLERDTLLWIGADDPCLTIESARKADPARLKLEAVTTQWRNVIKDDSVTAREVVERACRFELDPTTRNPNHIVYHHPEFRNALLDIAADHGRVDPGRLGSWLGHNKGKIVRVNGQGQTHDCRLIADTDAYGIGRWRLQERQADGWR